MTFDPSTPYFGNYSTTQMVMDSPIFKSEFDYNQGGTDLGKTQYEDAYQRGNFWGAVKTNTDYHLILKTVLGPEQTFTVPAGEGDVINNPWSGIPTGTADINWFDEQLQTVITKYKQINPSVLPLFITERLPDRGWLLHWWLSQRQRSCARRADLQLQHQHSASQGPGIFTGCGRPSA
jgi:hypothetical protein